MAARKTATNPTAAEALAQPIPFTFEGQKYSVLPSSEWSLDALEAFEEGRVLTLLREVLDGDGYATFRKTHNRVADLNEFVVAMQKAIGIAGN
ncbi:hypothetical protein [Microbacterium sp. XT11]|uniref:hypothetical protein n=1 Tax=Microbacterium sp. XT11 TaxID=367477 RepID=UPI000742F290|nr:hypothetical protein [Microbacterium sp. XT11]ALX67275.1 hypothetical protein AB663_003108 [Microbacterium sp. XT11]